jgi:hypothetical protein
MIPFPKPGIPGDGGGDELPGRPEPPPAHTGGFLSRGLVIPTMHIGGLAGDEMFIKAQTGEYMMRRSAVQRYGRGFMDSVNSGRFGGGSRVIQHTSKIYLDRREVGEALAEIYVN